MGEMGEEGRRGGLARSRGECCSKVFKGDRRPCWYVDLQTVRTRHQSQSQTAKKVQINKSKMWNYY